MPATVAVSSQKLLWPNKVGLRSRGNTLRQQTARLRDHAQAAAQKARSGKQREPASAEPISLRSTLEIKCDYEQTVNVIQPSREGWR